MTQKNQIERLIKLVCPNCREPITPIENGWRCGKCQRLYSYQRGILSFLNEADRFNEGEFEEKQKNAWSESAQFRLKVRSNPLLSVINSPRIHCSMSGRRDRVFLKQIGTLASNFNNEFKNKSPWIKLAVQVDKLLAKTMVVSEPLNLLLEPLAWIDDRLTSIDHGDVFEK